MWAKHLKMTWLQKSQKEQITRKRQICNATVDNERGGSS